MGSRAESTAGALAAYKFDELGSGMIKKQLSRDEGDCLIESFRWRVERHNDELALGIEPTEELEPLLQYVQDLRDMPQQESFPEAMEWPELPSVG